MKYHSFITIDKQILVEKTDKNTEKVLDKCYQTITFLIVSTDRKTNRISLTVNGCKLNCLLTNDLTESRKCFSNCKKTKDRI